jgi:hypothetical protein
MLMQDTGAMEGANAPLLPGYARMGSAMQGLDGALSAVSARPTEHDARGFVIEVLVWHPSW